MGTGVTTVSDFPQPDQAVVIGPDDRLAITYDRVLTMEESDQIREGIQDWWPGLRIAIFDGGARLTAISQAEDGSA